MEDVKADHEGQPVERREPQSSSYQPPAVQPHQTSSSRTLRTLCPRRSCYFFALAGAVWSVCQVEASPHPSSLLPDACWRLLLVSLMWMVLGCCVHVLKCCPRQGQKRGEPPMRIQQEVVTRNTNHLHSWVSQSSRSLGHGVPLAVALVHILQLCVLQEPLSDPSVPHIKSLLSRLESVSHTLERADTGSEVTLRELDQDSRLTDKVKLIRSYLQQRMRSLWRLIQVQEEFEASVKDMLGGLGGLWAQLEELHTSVTLTKEGSRSHKDLSSAQTDAETLVAVLGHHRSRLQCCQAHLKDSTQLLQELTWSHTHTSNSVSTSGESVWPELLLQSNIEQFDKVQESFLSLEQQTSTFQAHLEGLGKGNQEGRGGPRSCSGSPQASPHLRNGWTSDVSLEHSASTSVSSTDADTDTPISLCERSALQFSSTIGRLRKSGRRK